MPVQHVIEGHFKDLGGGFTVRRLLPAAVRQAVGPFVFFDHFGPVTSAPGTNHDVRPHPHIGLATVTYLFEGAMMHRDSTGAVQRIEPGAINLMTAGRGIVHSERTPEDLRASAHVVHGLQLWCALPEAMEECDPGFAHTPADAIPAIAGPGYAGRVMIGTFLGTTSPVVAASPTLYAEIALEPGAHLALGSDSHERAVYPLDADIVVDDMPIAACTLAVLDHGSATLAAPTGARIAIIGGAPLGHRHMVWNFVSSRKDRIDQAIAQWRAQAFDTVPGETEFIPY